MKKLLTLFTLLLVSFLLIGCQTDDNTQKDHETYERLLNTYANYDNYYQIFVRSFADSNGDGIGDLNGITNSLDYLVDLGITAIWLSPINPSPSYHGYDVLDYYDINPEYGTMADFDNLVSSAHDKGIKIIIDLVINHTSDQHPWYLNSRDRSSDTYGWYLNNGKEVRSFDGGMVDLNLNLEEVKNEIFKISKFYLDKGVAGFRLDAAIHFFEGDPNEINGVSKNILFINELKWYMQEIDPNSIIISEVFINDYNLTKEYYLTSDSLFDFYIKDELHNKIGNGTSTYLLVNNIIRAFEAYREFNPNFISGIFLSNHDIDRMASLNVYQNPNHYLRFLQSINFLLTIPGSPYLYYGDELGMKGYRYEGEVIGGRVVYDEYRRQPFIWDDANKLTTWLASDGSNDDILSVEMQMLDENSLYHYYKTLMNLRKDNLALRFGNELSAYNGNNSQIQGFIRHFEFEDLSQTLLIIHNMRESELTLDLDYEKLVYGDLTIPGHGMLILEIDYEQIGDYTNVSR